MRLLVDPQLPRVRVFNNRYGNVRAFLAAHDVKWWIQEPMWMGPEKAPV